jgi:U3 small nucleolar RNA-associated protein 22
VSLNFELVDGDQRRPCLVLSPIEGISKAKQRNLTPIEGSDSDFSKSRARIRILPSISRNLFPAQKLIYIHTQGQDGKTVKNIRCNIRTAPDTQTPLYNNAILCDSTHVHFLTQIYNASQTCPALLDAAILGKQWLRQRGFSSSFTHGGFGSFEWTWFVSYLLRAGGPSGRNVLETAFSSFQLFRGALNSLVIRDRVNDGAVEAFDECGVNVFYKMTPTSYLLVCLIDERC